MKMGLSRATVQIGLAAGFLMGAVPAIAVIIEFDEGSPSDLLNDGSLLSSPGIVETTFEIGEVAETVTSLSGLHQSGIANCWPTHVANMCFSELVVSKIDAANAIDHYWVQPVVNEANGKIHYKFDTAVSQVVAVPGIDHGPLPGEALEFIVWGSNAAGDLIEEGAIKAIFDAGIDPTVSIIGSSDDFASVWTFSTTFEYFVVRHGDHIKDFSSPLEFEFDGLAAVAIPAEDCDKPGGCDLGGVNIEFPPGTELEAGATVSTSTVRVNGDDARCGTGTTYPLPGGGELPAYLCGSPDFIMITTVLDGVDLPDDTIFVVNDTASVLPGNIYICNLDISPPFDPQHNDVLAWTTTDPTEMLENDLGGGEGFPGSVGEFTDDCGTTRGRVRGGSRYFIGLHIEAGPAYAENTAGNFDGLVALTNYKFQLLKKSVENAEVVLSSKDLRKLKKHVNQAIKQMGKGNYNAAHSHVKNFLNAVDKAKYNNVTIKIYKAEHRMRGSNIEFMLRERILPYAPPRPL